MSAMVLVCGAFGLAFVALAVSALQAHLEQWDHDRHAED
jgi:hypothetical protein